jgi:hypothetical protein
MEFGETIPLFFMTVCCIAVIPIIGFILLALIRFRLRDRQLAKNILLTVLGVGFLSFLLPILQLIWALVLITQDCGCETSFELTPKILTEMFLSSVQFGAFLIYPGIAFGFLIAYCSVLPITLVVRRFKKKTPQSLV